MAKASIDLLANWLGALAVATSSAQHGATVGGGADSRVAALLTLWEFPSTAVGELAAVLGLTHSAVVRVVDGLVADGLVQRSQAVDDARRVDLALTADGQLRASHLQRARLRALSGLLESLEPKQRDQLAYLIEAMLRGTRRDSATARRICRYCAHRICAGPTCPIGSSVEPLDGPPKDRP